MNIIEKNKTNIMGVVGALLTLLLAFGIVDVEPQAATDVVEGVVDAGSSALNEILALISAVVSGIGFFSKDGKIGGSAE